MYTEYKAKENCCCCCQVLTIFSLFKIISFVFDLKYLSQNSGRYWGFYTGKGYGGHHCINVDVAAYQLVIEVPFNWQYVNLYQIFSLNFYCFFRNWALPLTFNRCRPSRRLSPIKFLLFITFNLEYISQFYINFQNQWQFLILMTSRFQNCPWSLNLMKKWLRYARLKARLHFQRSNKSWDEIKFWN